MKKLIKIIILVLIIVGGFYLLRSMKASKESALHDNTDTAAQTQNNGMTAIVSSSDGDMNTNDNANGDQSLNGTGTQMDRILNQ